MGIKLERDFLKNHAGGDYKKGDPIYDTARSARNEFRSFCDEAFRRSDIFWGSNPKSGYSRALTASGTKFARYLWGHFAKKGTDSVCVIGLSMEGFSDDDYKLYAKFEIFTNMVNDKNPVVRKEIFDRFNKISMSDPGSSDIRYMVYASAVAKNEWLMDFDTAESVFERSDDQSKRICPSILIADGNEIDTCDDETLLDKAVRAINKLGKYYDAYYRAKSEEESMKKNASDTEEGESESEEVPKNTILFGPPGTGKTYNTTAEALKIITGVEWKVNDDARDKYNEFKDKGQIQFVTFHQSYGYEEFIEGVRPDVKDNDEGADGVRDASSIKYKLEDGVFKSFCKKAGENPGDNYVFIIDEINRGNISKIFGELITLIEDNKRAEEDEATETTLPYSKEPFSVPSNVYIIGTMNTADRSITAIDTALRRRFTFKEMMPDPDAIKTADEKPIKVEGVDVRRMLEKMNKRIEVLYDREHQIGHAYFMRLNNDSKVKDLARIFKNKIIPLLQEYFFDDYEKIGCVLGDNIIWDDNKPDREGEQFIRREKINVSKLFGIKNHPPLSEPCYVYSVNEKTPDKPEAYIKIYAEQPDKKETE